MKKKVDISFSPCLSSPSLVVPASVHESPRVHSPQTRLDHSSSESNEEDDVDAQFPPDYIYVFLAWLIYVVSYKVG